jgi:ABC-type nitrate/sulfonate/bicarbonate transport system substrate-binding protein
VAIPGRGAAVRAKVLVAVAVAVAGTVAGCSSAANSSAPPTTGAAGAGKQLSMSTVSYQASSNNVETLTGYIAEAEGFYKQQGLTVNYLDKSSSNVDQTIAGLLSGSYQFANEIVTSAIAADKANQLTQVTAIDDGAEQEVTIAQNTADALHITAPTSPADTAAQFKKLKGSHLTVAVTGFTAGTYNNLITVCQQEGLTCKQNTPSADINILSAGSAANQVAGLSAGHYQAIAAGVPIALQPNTVSLNMGDIALCDEAAFFGIITTSSFIKAHPDTVQAFVNAQVEAWNWTKKNPDQARALLVKMEGEINDLTNTTTVDTIFTDFEKYYQTPLLLQQPFTDAETILNTGQPASKVTLKFSDFNDPSFVAKAVSQLHITAPSSLQQPSE